MNEDEYPWGGPTARPTITRPGSATLAQKKQKPRPGARQHSPFQIAGVSVPMPGETPGAAAPAPSAPQGYVPIPGLAQYTNQPGAPQTGVSGYVKDNGLLLPQGGQSRQPAPPGNLPSPPGVGEIATTGMGRAVGGAVDNFANTMEAVRAGVGAGWQGTKVALTNAIEGYQEGRTGRALVDPSATAPYQPTAPQNPMGRSARTRTRETRRLARPGGQREGQAAGAGGGAAGKGEPVELQEYVEVPGADRQSGPAQQGSQGASTPARPGSRRLPQPTVLSTRTADEQRAIDSTVAGIESEIDATRKYNEALSDYRYRQQNGISREDARRRNQENQRRLDRRPFDPASQSAAEMITTRQRRANDRQRTRETATERQEQMADRLARQQIQAQRQTAQAQQAQTDRQYALDARNQQFQEEKAGWDIRLAVEQLQSDQEGAARLDPYAKLGAEMVMQEVEQLNEAAAQFGEQVTPEQMQAAMERGAAYERYARQQAGVYRSPDGQLWNPQDIQATLKANPELKTVEDVVREYQLQ